MGRKGEKQEGNRVGEYHSQVRSGDDGALWRPSGSL